MSLVVVDTEVNINDHLYFIPLFIRFTRKNIFLNSITHIRRFNLPPCSSSCCVILFWPRYTNKLYPKEKTHSPRLRGEVMKINLWIIHLLECWHTKWGERCSSKNFISFGSAVNNSSGLGGKVCTHSERREANVTLKESCVLWRQDVWQYALLCTKKRRKKNPDLHGMIAN